MNISNKGKIFLTGVEGVCLSLYLDSVNVRTIGIGVTRTEIPNINQLPWSYSITMKECFELLDKSLVRYEDAVNKALKVKVSQNQYDALVSICYNIGTGGLTKSTFMKRVNNGESAARIAQAIMMWNKPKEIIGRRAKEVDLYNKGLYGDGKALLFPVSPTSHKPIYSKGKSINVADYLDK